MPGREERHPLRADPEYPGQDLGLPQAGPGSLASWRARVAALVADWAACMVVAVLLFGTGVLTGRGWRSWTVLALFFVESSVLSLLVQGSLGQLLARIAVVRLDRQPLRPVGALIRAALVSLALPALVIGPGRRGLQDYAANTVVVNRR